MKFTEKEKEKIIIMLKNYLNNQYKNQKENESQNEIKNSWVTFNTNEYILEEICFLCKKLVKS